MSTVEEDHVGPNEYPTVSSNENEFDESDFHNYHDDVDDFPESEYEPDDDPYDSGYEADGDPYELSDDPDETWFYRMVPGPRMETDQQYYYARKKWYEANSAHEDETESDYETNRWRRKTAIANGLLEVDDEDDDDDNENPSSDLLVEVDEDEKIDVPSVQGKGATGNVGGDSAVNEVGKALMEHLGIAP